LLNTGLSGLLFVRDRSPAGAGDIAREINAIPFAEFFFFLDNAALRNNASDEMLKQFLDTYEKLKNVPHASYDLQTLVVLCGNFE
jgi:hypothetical protein